MRSRCIALRRARRTSGCAAQACARRHQPAQGSPSRSRSPTSPGSNGNAAHEGLAARAPQYFTGEFRADITYIGDFNHPKDHTLVGTSESGRTSEIQVQQLGIGGDFHCGDVRGRLMTQFGMYSTMTPRNDASPARGQWQLDNAYRYHLRGVRRPPLERAERHQPRRRHLHVVRRPVQLLQLRQLGVSAVVRLVEHAVVLQRHPRSSSSRATSSRSSRGSSTAGSRTACSTRRRASGMQILLAAERRRRRCSRTTTTGTTGSDIPDRWRVHTDNSLAGQVSTTIRRRRSDKAAFSLTVDAGCETRRRRELHRRYALAVRSRAFSASCSTTAAGSTNDKFGLTLGGGAMNNPGRYLVLLPPINGATAFSGTPYFTPTRATSSRRGTRRSRSTTCRTSSHVPRRAQSPRSQRRRTSRAGGVTPVGGNTGAPGSVVPDFEPGSPQDGDAAELRAAAMRQTM